MFYLCLPSPQPLCLVLAWKFPLNSLCAHNVPVQSCELLRVILPPPVWFVIIFVLGLVMVACTSGSVLVALPVFSTCAGWLSAGWWPLSRWRPWPFPHRSATTWPTKSSNPPTLHHNTSWSNCTCHSSMLENQWIPCFLRNKQFFLELWWTNETEGKELTFYWNPKALFQMPTTSTYSRILCCFVHTYFCKCFSKRVCLGQRTIHTCKVKLFLGPPLPSIISVWYLSVFSSSSSWLQLSTRFSKTFIFSFDLKRLLYLMWEALQWCLWVSNRDTLDL